MIMDEAVVHLYQVTFGGDSHFVRRPASYCMLPPMETVPCITASAGRDDIICYKESLQAASPKEPLLGHTQYRQLLE
jgi:hypothetical protein